MMVAGSSNSNAVTQRSSSSGRQEEVGADVARGDAAASYGEEGEGSVLRDTSRREGGVGDSEERVRQSIAGMRSGGSEPPPLHATHGPALEEHMAWSLVGRANSDAMRWEEERGGTGFSDGAATRTLAGTFARPLAGHREGEGASLTGADLLSPSGDGEHDYVRVDMDDDRSMDVTTTVTITTTTSSSNSHVVSHSGSSVGDDSYDPSVRRGSSEVLAAAAVAVSAGRDVGSGEWRSGEAVVLRADAGGATRATREDEAAEEEEEEEEGRRVGHGMDTDEQSPLASCVTAAPATPPSLKPPPSRPATHTTPPSLSQHATPPSAQAATPGESVCSHSPSLTSDSMPYNHLYQQLPLQQQPQQQQRHCQSEQQQPDVAGGGAPSVPSVPSASASASAIASDRTPSSTHLPCPPLPPRKRAAVQRLLQGPTLRHLMRRLCFDPANGSGSGNGGDGGH